MKSLSTYVGSNTDAANKIYTCPSDEKPRFWSPYKSSFAFNSNLKYIHPDVVLKPSKTLEFLDAENEYMNFASQSDLDTYAGYRHPNGRGVNILYVDGHIIRYGERLTLSDFTSGFYGW